MSDDYGGSKLLIMFIGIGSAAFVVTVYHCITVGWCNRQSSSPSPTPSRPDLAEMPSSVETSAAHLIPAHKYKKGSGLVGSGDEDGACPVCLCEYEEGEELRTLPECLHSYHAPCIDMWLHSHSNCPMCRTAAAAATTPLPPQELQPASSPPLPPPPDFGSERARANTSFQYISITL